MEYLLFVNFETSKLVVENADLINTLIFFEIGIFSLISLKIDTDAARVLCKSQTDQLKGLSILFVILGHLWVHVAADRAGYVFSGEAVALFLMLSGFGLTVSMKHKAVDLKFFLMKRIKRVMIPYWLATVLLLTLDYILLDKTYSFVDIILTALGFNFNDKLYHLDYVRWFITFIWVWYLIFYITVRIFSFSKVAWLLVLISLLLFPVHYYVLKLNWYQFFAFPAGCTAGIYYQSLEKTFQMRKNQLGISAITAFVWILLYKNLLSTERVGTYLWEHVPNILILLTQELNGLLFCFVMIVGIDRLGKLNYRSRFLEILGRYSYELFLLHGAFLIKYNFFFNDGGSSQMVLVGICLLTAFLLLLSLILSKINELLQTN